MAGVMAAKVGGAVAGARRAFGDIGNVVGGLAPREAGKENVAGCAPPLPPGSGRLNERHAVRTQSRAS